MKCAYCGQPCNDRGYGNNDYKEYDAEINNGMELVIRIHNKCLPKILGQWVRDKIHPVLYGAPYDCAPKVTCGSVKWDYEPSVTCDTVPSPKEGE